MRLLYRKRTKAGTGRTSSCSVYTGVVVHSEDICSRTNQLIVQLQLSCISHTRPDELTAVLNHQIPFLMDSFCDGPPAVYAALACRKVVLGSGPSFLGRDGNGIFSNLTNQRLRFSGELEQLLVQ